MLDHGGMMRPQTFVACHSCGCHAKAEERDCPHCGARLRRSDGSIPRAAAALLLGLTAAAMPTGIIACSDEVSSTTSSGGNGGQGGDVVQSAAAYGVSASISSGGGMGGAGGMGGMGGDSTGSAAAYGVPATDADQDGYFDQNFGGDDCDDTNAQIHPGAVETAGDGVDSNCDGQDDT